MREINGKIGAHNDEEYSRYTYSRPSFTLSSYFERKGKERKGKEGCVLGAASQASSISWALLLL